MELEDAIGAQWRAPEGGRKADRAAALLYTASQRRHGGSGPHWSTAQRWILDGGGTARPVKYFIGETVRESAEMAGMAPLARPGLIRVAGLAYALVPGPIVVERSASVGPDVLAVLGGYLEAMGRELVTWRPGSRNGPFSAKKDDLRGWIKDAALAPVTVDRWVEELTSAAEADFAGLLNDRRLQGLTHLGEGPCRDVDLAREVALVRAEAGWNDAHIRDYLSLYGFTNDSGTVGVWSHAQYSRLIAGVR
jgi:hypothetical protein